MYPYLAPPTPMQLFQHAQDKTVLTSYISEQNALRLKALIELGDRAESIRMAWMQMAAEQFHQMGRSFPGTPSWQKHLNWVQRATHQTEHWFKVEARIENAIQTRAYRIIKN